jgi:hypothetical protein
MDWEKSKQEVDVMVIDSVGFGVRNRVRVHQTQTSGIRSPLLFAQFGVAKVAGSFPGKFNVSKQQLLNVNLELRTKPLTVFLVIALSLTRSITLSLTRGLAIGRWRSGQFLDRTARQRMSVSTRREKWNPRGPTFKSNVQNSNLRRADSAYPPANP